MIGRSGQLTIDLQALMRQLETCPAAGRLEAAELFLGSLLIHTGWPHQEIFLFKIISDKLARVKRFFSGKESRPKKLGRVADGCLRI
jgi:hypothetical protein